MTFVVVQRGSWPGWPGGVVLELQSDCAAAVLTAARDYQAASGRNLKGDISALPVGCLRTAAEVVEMQWAFDHRHDGGTNGAKSAALYAHYNMDRASNARPSSTSPHLTGYCVDISDNGFLAWLIVNGARYGLRRTLVAANDLRHFQYFPGTATAALDVTGLNNDTITPPTIYGDTMLSMNRTKDNTIAFFDGEHWQEFKYTSNNAPTATIKQYQLDFINGLNHSIPSVPYDDLGWNLRSNKLPALKKPLFDDNGTSIIPIAQTDGTVADNSAVLAAIAALDAQADARQVALLSKLDGVGEATLATFGLKRA